MRLAVFGATGRLGSEIVRAARGRGHTVTAHARTPRGDAQSGVDWVTGDATDAVKDADAALLAFGPRSPADAPFCTAETQRILAGMSRHGVNRILCVTGAMVGDYPGNRTWCFQHLAAWIQSRYPELMEDRARQEELVGSSGMNWTILKPPRLTQGKSQAHVAIGSGVLTGLLSRVSRGDLAREMVEEAGQGRFSRQCVFVKEKW